MENETAVVNGKRSDAIGDLAAALAKAQGEIKGAVKDSSNPFFKSAYADLASVWDACRVPLAKNALAIVQCPRGTVDGIEVETLLIHQSGQWISEILSIPVSKRDAQSMGSAITYARRYALASFVGVAPEDDDGNAATKSNVQSPTSNVQEPKEKSKRKKIDEVVEQGKTQFDNAYHFEIAKKQQLCNEFLILPCFDKDRDSEEFKKFYDKINRKDHTLESISNALKIVKDQADIRAKAQKQADKESGLEIKDEDLPLLQNIESSKEAF